MKKVYDGLFIGPNDIREIKEKIKKYTWAYNAAGKLNDEGQNCFKQKFIPMDYSWYVPFKNLTESITVENYRNFNGILYYGMNQNLHRAYILCNNIILLDKHEYIETVKHTLLYYAENYPLHYFIMVDSGLVLSLLLLKYLYIADALKQYFTAEEIEKIYIFIEGIAEDILQNHEDWKLCSATKHQHCNNHNIWACAALMTYGLYFYKHDLVEYALHDSEGLIVYLEDAVIDNGLGIESSIGYNLFTVQALIKAAEAARRSNYKVDLYRHRSSRGISIDDIMLEIFQIASPDFSIPQLGDCYGHRQKPNTSDIYEYAYAAYNRPEYGWLLENTDRTNIASLLVGRDINKSEKINSISKIYGQHGFISLKSTEGKEYWNSDSFHLAAGFGYNGIHSNCDQLAITLFGKGKVLIHDHESISSGRHAFSSDIQRELNRSRLSHSTVIADGRETNSIPFPQTLGARLYKENGSIVALMDDGGKLYNGIVQKRILCVNENFIIDIFSIKSSEEHTYDWILHAYDDDTPYKADKDDEFISDYFRNKDNPAYNWIYNPDFVKSDEDIKIHWNVDGVKFSLFMKGEPGTELLRFSLPERDDLKGKMSSSAAVRRTGRNVIFAGIYGADGTEYEITDITESVEKFGITLTYIKNNDHKSKVFDFNMIDK